MRTLSGALQTAQQSLNRSPNSRIITRDVFLRLGRLTDSAIASNFPDDTLSSIPQCPYDFLIDTSGHAWRAWMESSHLYAHCVTGTLSDFASWETGTPEDLTLNETHRPSLADDKLFYGDSSAEKIYYRNLQVGGALGVQTQYADVPGLESKFALAATATGCYIAELAESGGATDFKHVQILKVNGVGYGSKSPSAYPSSGATGGGAGVAWSDPGNISADDNTYASISYDEDDSDPSEVLQARNFGFNVPERSTIDGIIARVGRYTTRSDTAYRKQVTITWNIATAATDYPVCITIDTATLVAAGKMAADCSDLRVFVDGIEVDRWIADPNDATTNVWVLLDFTADIGSQHTIYVYYGSLGAQTPDDTIKPMFNLSTSSNTSWVFEDFGHSTQTRAAEWVKSENIGQTGNATATGYTNSEGGNANPYNVIGCDGDISSGAVSDSKIRWYLQNVCGITNINITSAKYKLDFDTSSMSSMKDSASTTAEVADGGTERWTDGDPFGDISDNGPYYVDYNTPWSQFTFYRADMTNYGFAIPTNATIIGIKLYMDNCWYDSDGTDTSKCKFNKIGLWRSGSKVNHGTNPDFGPPAAKEQTFGGAADLWGTAWTPAIINASGFGWFTAGQIYNDTPNGDIYAYCAGAELTVYYTRERPECKFMIESSPDGAAWTEEWEQDAENDLTNDNSWHSFTRNEALTAGAKYVAFSEVVESLSSPEEMDLMAEVSTATLTLDNTKTPTVSIGSENTDHHDARDVTVQLVKAGTPTGDNKANVVDDWPGAEAEASYGGAADLWGTAWTPMDINNANFGLNAQCDFNMVDGNGYVDYVEIAVHYTPMADESPHAIVVDPDYTVSSLMWFDAVTLGSKDVIVVNRRTYGDPVVMFYEDGAWSDPQPILPADIVDNYTFLRISGMSVITDSDGDDVIWACGRIGRGGSTGLNAQEWDCVLRTKDGEHWTLDRMSYLCRDAMRGRLQVSNETVYYPGGATVMHGYRTWLMGMDNNALKTTISDDILGWQYSQPGLSQPSQGVTGIADHDGDYKPGINWSPFSLDPKLLFLLPFGGAGPLETEFDVDLDDLVNLVSPSTETGSIVGVEGKFGKGVSLCEGFTNLEPCPAFQYGTTGWATGGTNTIAQSSAQAKYGDCSLKCTYQDHAYLAYDTITLTAAAHSLSAWVYIPSDYDGTSIRLLFSGFTSGVGTAYADANMSLTDQWQLVQVPNYTPDAGDLAGNLMLYEFGSPTAGKFVYLDGVQCTATSYCLPFRFGDMPGCVWTGTPGQSTTTVTASNLEYTLGFPDEFTVSLWLNPLTLPSEADDYLKVLEWYADGSNLVRFQYDPGSDHLAVLVRCSGSNMTLTHSDLSRNTWYHIVLTNDGTDCVLFVDGDSVDTDLTPGVFSATSATLGVGSNVSGTQNINGTLDDLAILSRVMSAAEVGVLYSTSVFMRRAYSRTGIWAGYWLWRYAGYNGNDVLLSTEAIDRTPSSYRAGDRQLRIESRDVVMKQLTDWASDQDWQWLSQQKNYDDCDEIDRLYSISGTQIEVTSGDVKALVDQTEMIESDDANEIYYDTLNNEGIFLCTKPGECNNFVISATFRYTTNTNGRNLALGGSPQYLGFGFGVVGCVHSAEAQYNLVAAYYDTKTDELYLLRRSGDGDTNSWEELASSGALAGAAAENQRNRIELHRDGPNFTARILRFTQGSDASELASVEYEWAKTAWPSDQDDDRGRVGVLCNMDVTSAVGTECIYITDVQAYDGDDPDKSLEWTLEDIAAKAGVMDFETAYSVNETPFSGDDTPATAVWLQDINDDYLYQRDFDLTLTLPNQIEDGDSLVIIAKASSQLAVAPTDGNLTSFSGCKITYLRSGTSWYVQFHQTTADASSSSKANWVLVDEVVFDLSVDDTAGGKRVRVVGYDDFFAVYINNRWIRTFHLGPIFDDPDDGYDSTMEDGPGYIGVYRGGSGADWTNMTVRQPELWTWTDGIILDQRMNAVAGIQRVIKDRRIYLLPRPDGTLKLSQFPSRDSLVSLGDQIYEDSDNPTDRIATRIRAVGEEISDYIDHNAARDWGVTFALVQCPSLAEQESYVEAQKIIEDTVANASGRQVSHASRVDWEPEDGINISYSPADGGSDVNDDYVVSSVGFTYNPADLRSTAFLREDRS